MEELSGELTDDAIRDIVLGSGLLSLVPVSITLPLVISLCDETIHRPAIRFHSRCNGTRRW